MKITGSLVQITLLLLSFCLLGCTGGRIINKAYASADFSNASLAFFHLLEESVNVYKTSALENKIPGHNHDPDVSMGHALMATLCSNSLLYLEDTRFISTSHMQRTGLNQYSDDPLFTYSPESRHEDGDCYHIPRPEVLQAMFLDVDLLFIIEEINFLQIPGTTPAWSGKGALAISDIGSPPMVISDIRYILWHCRDSQPVVSCNISVKIPFNDAATAETWSNHFSRITEALYAQTPLTYIPPLPEGSLNDEELIPEDTD